MLVQQLKMSGYPAVLKISFLNSNWFLVLTLETHSMNAILYLQYVYESCPPYTSPSGCVVTIVTLVNMYIAVSTLR